MYLVIFYVYEYFCLHVMCVCASCVCLVPMEKMTLDPQELGIQMIAANTWVLGNKPCSSFEQQMLLTSETFSSPHSCNF